METVTAKSTQWTGIRAGIGALHQVVTLGAWTLACLVAACGPSTDEHTVRGREVSAACGRCIFEMEEATVGCPWAIELDGKAYLVQGEIPQGHNNHAPDGICNMRRRAIVDGTVRGDRFISTRFELKAADDVPEVPRFTPADKH